MVAEARVSAAPAAAATSGASVAPNGDVSQLFTTLLIAQIRNQNPLEPTDPAEFVGQLTQLSQMEALQKLVDQGGTQAALLDRLQVLALGAQVGSQVTATADRVELAGVPVEGRFALASGAAGVAVVLSDADGRQRRFELGAHGPGDAAFQLDPAALGLAPGSYGLRLEAATGERPAAEIAGTLRGVRVSPGGGLVLDVAGLGTLPATAITGFGPRP